MEPPALYPSIDRGRQASVTAKFSPNLIVFPPNSSRTSSSFAFVHLLSCSHYAMYIHHHLKRRLASVSRRWRHIIMNSAKFWTTIELAPTRSESLVKVHLARSSECFLDIEICGPWPHDIAAHILLVNLLISYSYRWHSVAVWYNVAGAQLVELLSRMEHKTFPLLSHLSVEYTPDRLCNNLASQLCIEHFPRLEHLGLGGLLNPSLTGRVPPNLTSLALSLNDQGPSSVIQRLSLQKLTSLTVWPCWVFTARSK